MIWGLLDLFELIGLLTLCVAISLPRFFLLIAGLNGLPAVLVSTFAGTESISGAGVVVLRVLLRSLTLCFRISSGNVVFASSVVVVVSGVLVVVVTVVVVVLGDGGSVDDVVGCLGRWELKMLCGMALGAILT